MEGTRQNEEAFTGEEKTWPSAHVTGSPHAYSSGLRLAAEVLEALIYG